MRVNFLRGDLTMSIGILIIASIGLISWSYVIYIGISRMIDYKIKKSHEN